MHLENHEHLPVAVLRKIPSKRLRVSWRYGYIPGPLSRLINWWFVRVQSLPFCLMSSSIYVSDIPLQPNTSFWHTSHGIFNTFWPQSAFAVGGLWRRCRYRPSTKTYNTWWWPWIPSPLQSPITIASTVLFVFLGSDLAWSRLISYIVVIGWNDFFAMRRTSWLLASAFRLQGFNLHCHQCSSDPGQLCTGLNLAVL